MKRSIMWLLVLNTFIVSAKKPKEGNLQNPKQTFTLKANFSEPVKPGSIRYNIGRDFHTTAMLNIRDFEYSSEIKDNGFVISVDDNLEHPYVKMYFGLLTGQRLRKQQEVLCSNPYYLPKEGEVKLTISPDTVIFTGNGADLLRCQYLMYKLDTNDVPSVVDNQQLRELNDAVRSSSYYKSLLSKKKQFESVYKAKMSILNTYRTAIGAEAYLRLKYDFYGDYMSIFLTNLCYDLDLGVASQSAELKQTMVQFYNDHYWFNAPDLATDSAAKKESFLYSLFLYRKSFCDLYIPLMANTGRIKPGFDEIYPKLLADYKGRMLDWVLGNCFLLLSTKHVFPTWGYADALSRVGDESVREIIYQQKASRVIGTDAYNFSLKDSSGMTVTLKDLRGRVLILDFWYTGCKGCIGLARNMPPIYDYYRGNKKVLFLSICIDEDMNKWKKSIRGGQYTHHDALNLYTGGNGAQDPLIVHYGIQSYPTLMIIDDKGKILSVNPPRPLISSPIRNNQFKALIDEHLKTISE